MPKLDRELTAKLVAMRARIESPDEDTVLVCNVPVNRRLFNKPRTNLLLKRPRAGLPFFVYVDEDLEYRGPDPHLTRAFAAGLSRQGWRLLNPGLSPQTDFHGAARAALSVLGFDGPEPADTPPERAAQATRSSGLLAKFGTNLSARARTAPAEPTIGRTSEAEQVASCVLHWGQTRLCVIVGAPGVGKSNLLHAVARRLSQRDPNLNLIRVNLARLLAGTLFEAEREKSLTGLLEQAAAAPGTILAVEHLDLALPLPHAALLLAQFGDEGVPIIGTTLPEQLPRFDQPPLARRIAVVRLRGLSAGDTLRVLHTLAPQIARRHRVEISESCLCVCVRAAGRLPGHFPSEAIALLDAAAAAAVWSGAAVIGPDEVYFAAEQAAQGASP